MFTGLTNQMSGWMGSVVKKGENDPSKPEDKLASPLSGEEPTTAQENNDLKKDASPTKPGGRLEMLSSVKSQMTGWLGSASIPGLRRGADETADPNAAPAPTGVESPASEKSVKGSPGEPKEDDDNSSATGGADSDAQVSENEEEEDKDGAAVGVSTKAIQGAKSLGGFLYSAVSKAGAKVSEAGAKIKKTVEENVNSTHLHGSGLLDPVNLPVKNLLGDFNKEQEAFIKDKNSKGSEAAVPPWVGCPNEERLKEECLSLSDDRRNFVRSPPAGVDFNFDYDVTFPVAQAILAEDPNLDKMRFELVPKVISEENFWRNYFYRVSLICQANELSSMAKEGGATGSRTSSTDAEPAVIGARPTSSTEQSMPNVAQSHDVAGSPTNEFVSDTFAVSSQDLEEVRQGMLKLGLDPVKNEEEWEKELENELQDYEVVADGDGSTSNSNNNWEHQIEDMLDEETDLK